MPANANDACCVYWITDETCADPYADGYIGITKNVQSRWSSHRRRFSHNAKIEVIFGRDNCQSQAARGRLTVSSGLRSAATAQRAAMKAAASIRIEPER